MTTFTSMTLAADRRRFPLRLSCIICLLWMMLTGCSKQDSSLYEFSGSTMGTTYSISAAELPENLLPQQLADRIQAELDAVDSAMSTYRSESEVSAFNRLPAGGSMVVSADTFEVLKKSLNIWRRSQGAFDVTVGPLVDLWRFDSQGRPMKMPDEQARRDAWKQVGSDALQLFPDVRKVEKRKNLQLNLSTVAKGYGVDKVAEALESLGIRRYRVEVGGEVRVGDRKDRQKPWHEEAGEAVPPLNATPLMIEVANVAVAHAGGYRHYFEQEGVRYSNIIDPRTGKPIQHKLVSATVIAPDCADANAWATAIMALGPEQGVTVADAQNLAVYLQVKTENGIEAKYSKAFAMYLPRSLQ